MSKISESMPVFKWEFNAGHLLTISALLITGLVYAVRQEGKVEILDQRLKVIEARAAVYIPRIESLQEKNTLQDERLAATGEALRQLRQINDTRDATQAKAISDILSKLGDIREDLATIKATIARDGVPLPNLRHPPVGR